MIYRSFNEGLFDSSKGRKVPDSYYKLCEDILSYVEKNIGDLKYNDTMFTKIKKVKDNKVFKNSVNAIKKLVVNAKKNNKSSCRFIIYPYAESSNEVWRVLMGIQSKFKLKNRERSDSILRNVMQRNEVALYRKEDDGSYTVVSMSVFVTTSYGMECGVNTITINIKNYEDEDKAKKKLNLKESTNCGIFSNIDFI